MKNKFENRRNVKSLSEASLDKFFTTVDGHKKKKNFLTQTEVQRLASAAYSMRSPFRNRLLINLMYRHGLRVSEAINITLDDLNLEYSRIWINRLKGGLSTEQPLDKKVVRRDIKTYLKVRPDKNGIFLFQNESGNKLTRQGVSYIIKSAAEVAGLKNVHAHTLRHSCGYYLANKGYDLRLIQDYLGHIDPRHTALYTRTNSKRFENLWKI